ncbi:MAG: hypothetical protein RR744_05750 [Cellulosilyticaceae bacterium]
MQTLRETIWIYLSGFGCVLILFLVGIIKNKHNEVAYSKYQGIISEKMQVYGELIKSYLDKEAEYA